MSKQIRCSKCKSTELMQTNTKNCFQCKRCGTVTDIRGWEKHVGPIVGGFLGIVTVGLLPDEVYDEVSDFFDDLLS